MSRLIVACVLLGCGLASGTEAESAESSSVFVIEPQDAWVRPGGTVQLDCELTTSSEQDICAWRLTGTHLGVDHFYNVAPPDRVRPLFPEHERICSVLIEDADWRHDGYWTCWPLEATSHVSSRDARLTVTDKTTPVPTPSARTTTEQPATETTEWPSTETTQWPSTETTEWPSTETTSPGTSDIFTTIPASTATERPWTSPEPATSTSAASSTSETTSTEASPTTRDTSPATTTTTAPSTATELPVTTASPSPSPQFACPQPNGLFADPADTRYFYFCEDGVAVHMQCELPKQWNDTSKTCL